MKKYQLIAILLSVLLSEGYSQDKIITVKNDTIDRKIIVDEIAEDVKSSGKILTDSFSSYTNSGKTTQEVQKTVNIDPFKRLRLGINGGLGYLLGSTEIAEDYLVNLGLTRDQAESYYNDMKSGLYANADLTYLISPKYGVGIRYKFFDTSCSTGDFFYLLDGVNLIYTTYEEQIYVNFIGASFFYQQWIRSLKSLKVNSSLSFGLATYRNEAGYLNSSFLLTGKNIGMDISLGFEYFITDNFSVGADLSTFYSSIGKMKISDGSSTSTVNLGKDNSESLSRLDLSLGIRLYLWNK